MTATQVRTSRVGEKLVGRAAFATGGGRGIVAAIARSIASQGAEFAVGYSGDKAAEAFRSGASEDFPECHATVHRGDIGSADDCRRTGH